MNSGSSPSTRHPVHFAYFAVALICLGIGIADGTGLYEVRSWKEIQLIGLGLVALAGGLWSILAERLRAVNFPSTSSLSVQLPLLATNLFIGGHVVSGLGRSRSDEEALMSIALYLMSALVGFLAVHIASARSREQVAYAAGRWSDLSFRVLLAFGGQLLAIGIIDDLLKRSAEDVFATWFVVTTTAAMLTGVVVYFTGSSAAFHRERGLALMVLAVGGAFGLLGCFALLGGEPQLFFGCGLLGLLIFDLMRPIREVRAFNSLGGGALAGAALVGTHAAIRCGADGAMWAPVGIATAGALVLSVVSHIYDRKSSHIGWMLVSGGMFVAAMLPYEVADAIANAF